MEPGTHKVIGPIFTAGASTYYMAAKQVGFTLDPVAITTIAVIVSYFSSGWPDADQAAKEKPVPVILYGVKAFSPYCAMTGVRMKKVSTNGGKPSKRICYKGEYYTQTYRKRYDLKLWAAFFRAIGVRKHRCFRTHGPLLWIPVWFFICNLVYTADTLGILSGIIQGCAFGYLSHILADAFTVDSVPLLPEPKFIKKIPFLGAIYHWIANFKIFRWGAFKASNKLWNFIVIFIILDAVLFFAFPDIGKPLNQGLLDFTKTIGLFLFNSLKTAFTKS